MAESYSTSLKITLIGDGDLAGTWGDTTNTNWNLIEQAVVGVDTLSAMGDSNYTLSNLNGASDEARNQVIVIPSSTTLTATRYIYAPFVQKTYIISNQSSGGQAVYIQGIVSSTPTGSPLLIPNGVAVQVYCDGVNGFFSASTGSAGNFSVNGNLSVTGNTAEVGNLSVSGTAAFSGTTTAPTQVSTDNSTKVATTAFVQSIAGGLGTMSTQNANNVNITGGTMSGMTSIADSVGNVRTLPIENKTTGYTLLATDNGQVISITTGGVTVPSGVFSAGQVVTIFNNSGSSQTITQGSGVTMYLAGVGTTGNRTLGLYGVCTVLCVASNTFVAAGSGVS